MSIIKPFSSRFANSERYVVCNGFDVFKANYIWENPKDGLLNIIDEWAKQPDSYLNSLGLKNNVINDKNFLSSMHDFNINMICQQIINLLKGFHFCDSYKTLASLSSPDLPDFNNFQNF